MWNAAGAALAKAVYWGQQYGDHTFGTGVNKVTVCGDGITIGDGDMIKWCNLNDVLINQCVPSILPSDHTTVVLIPDLLKRMHTWEGVYFINDVGDFYGAKVLPVSIRENKHIIVAYPSNAPILFVADDEVVKFINNTSRDWYMQERITADSLGEISATSVAGFGYTGGAVLAPDEWNKSDILNFFNEGKPVAVSDIIGEKVHRGIWEIINQSTDSVERYKTLVGALRYLDNDLPDTLDVILQVDRS